MNPRKLEQVKLGDVVTYNRHSYEVHETTGTTVTLVGVDNDDVRTILTSSLLMDDIEIVGRVPASRQPQRTLKDVGLKRKHAGRRAEIWECAILLLETGIDHFSKSDDVSPKFDPSRPLRKRVKSLQKWLLHHGVLERSTRTIYRKRAAFLASPNVVTLVDHRVIPEGTSPFGRAKKELVDAFEFVLDQHHDASDITNIHLIGDVRDRMNETHPGFDFPSDSSMRRYLRAMIKQKNWATSTKQRVTSTKNPTVMYGPMSASRPGELVMVDTTSVSVRFLDDNDVPHRYEMSILFDVFSRMILAFVLARTTSAATIMRLIARALVPPTFLSGGAAMLRMAEAEATPGSRTSSSSISGGRPYVAIETLVFDNGKPYTAHFTKESLEYLEIGIRYCRIRMPEDKGPVERAMKTAEQGVIEYLKGYVGRSTEHRGPKAEASGLLHRTTADVLIDTWFSEVWAHRKSRALKSPYSKKKRYSPYQALTAAAVMAPALPLPQAGDLYISFLETDFRIVGSNGIDHAHMQFDSHKLGPLRAKPSGDLAHGGRYQVMWDPDFNVYLWVFDPAAKDWICCTRRDLGEFDRPYVGQMLRALPGTEELVVLDSDRATRDLVARFDSDLTAPMKPQRTRTAQPARRDLPVVRIAPASEVRRRKIRLMTEDDLDGDHVL